VLAGAGVGIVNPTSAVVHLGLLPPSRAGVAAAANNMARHLGVVLGVLLLGWLAPSLGSSSAPAAAHGLATALRWAVALAVLGGLAGLLADRTSARRARAVLSSEPTYRSAIHTEIAACRRGDDA
jgi:MFS family permease